MRAFGARLALRLGISAIEAPFKVARESAKATKRAGANKLKREEFEALEKERIRNLPPIDQEQLDRVEKTMKAYLEYREREKLLKQANR